MQHTKALTQMNPLTIMKQSIWILSFLILSYIRAQSGEVQYFEVDRGPHHKTLERIEEGARNVGGTRWVTNQYVEVATGLHYWDQGQWKETREEIQIVNGFAVAQEGPHKLVFASNLNSPGAIDMECPEGKRFRSHILGIAYTDALSGSSAIIATVKDCEGAVLGFNQVVYQDAFEGDLMADVRYTYQKGKFEQDVLVLVAPPDPRVYGEGFDPSTTRLEIWTEFIEIPQGQVQRVVLKRKDDPVARAGMFEPDLIDERLDFGAMKFETGQAFPDSGSDDFQILTGKSLEFIEGRIFLIEKVDYRVEVLAKHTSQWCGLNHLHESHRDAGRDGNDVVGGHEGIGAGLQNERGSFDARKRVGRVELRDRLQPFRHDLAGRGLQKRLVERRLVRGSNAEQR